MAHILKADETILVMRRMKELYYPLLTVKYLPYIQSRWSVPCSLSLLLSDAEFWHQQL